MNTKTFTPTGTSRLTNRARWVLFTLPLLAVAMFCSLNVWSQTSVQNFGTGTGSHTSQTGSTSFIPNPTSGTTVARGGATAPAAPIILANTSNPLGTTGSFVNGVASTSPSVSKITPILGYTGTTEFYTSMKVLFGNASGAAGPTNGSWSFFQGAGATYSDNSDFSTAQTFASARFVYASAGALTLQYRNASTWTSIGLTTSTFAQATVYTIEIVGNNKTSGTISYNYNGNANTVAVQKFDLFINGTLIGDDLVAGGFPANTVISATMFTGISSTTPSNNNANVFADDVTVYNAVPANIGVSTPTTQVTSIAFSSVLTTSMTASWTNGNGARRAVFMKETSGAITNPTNNVSYTASSNWSSKGTQLGTSGYYCIYDGTGSSVNLTNLSPNTNYVLQAFEYNSSGSVVLYNTTTASGNPNNQSTPSAGTPDITVTSSMTAFGNVNVGTTSAEKTYTVSGTLLTANIDLTAPTDYQISTTSGSGFGSTLSLTPSSGTVATTTIYVRFQPTSQGTIAGNITHVSAGATTKNAAVTGTGVIPVITVGTVTAFADQVTNTVSAQKTYNVSGVYLESNITITPPSGFLISTTSGSGYASTPIVLTPSSGTVASTPIYVVFAPTATTSYAGDITHTGTNAVTKNTAVSGNGVGLITVTPTSLAFGNQNINTTSAEQSFTVSGTDLINDITVNNLAGYEISLTSGSGFTTSPIVLTHAAGVVASTTIYVHFMPTAVQSYNGNITNVSVGSTTKNVALTGGGIIPPLHYRTAASGTWGTVATWESSSDLSTWIAASAVPVTADLTVTIKSGHNITTSSTRSIDQLTIENGASLTVQTTGVFTIDDGTGVDLTLDGTLINNSTTGSITSLGQVTVGATGIWRHDKNSGTVPTATWHLTSTLDFVGVTATQPSGLTGQTFGNIIWNCPGQTASVNLSGTLTSIAGNFTISNTGASTLLRFFGSSIATCVVNIGGNLIINNTNARVQFSNNISGAISSGTLNIGGFVMSAGSFAPNINPTSVILLMNFTGANSTYNVTGGTFTNAAVSYKVNTGAKLTLNSNLDVATSRNITVDGTLNCLQSVVSGAGAVTIGAAGTLQVGSYSGSGAIAGNITATGTFTLTSGSTVEYNGTTATQSAASRTFTHVKINNPFGVTFTGILTIRGNLTNTAGSEINSGAFNHIIKGNWDNQGTFNHGGGKWTFDTTIVQSINSTTFNDLEIKNPAGVTFTGGISINGNFANLASSVLNAGVNTHNLVGTWSNSGTINNSGKWIFNGSSVQSISSTTFNDIELSNAAGVTFAGAMTVNGTLTNNSGSTLNSGLFTHILKGNWSNAGTFNHGNGKWLVNGTSAQSMNGTSFNQLETSNAAGVSFSSAMTINSDFTNASGSVLNSGSATHTLKGNWSNAGTFNHNSGKWILNGTSAQSVNNGSFNHLTLSNAVGVSLTGAITVNGILENASGSMLNSGAFTHNVKGNWDNQGTFNHNNGKWIFSGSSAQTANATNFYQLEINNAAGVTFTGVMNVDSDLTNASGSILHGGAFTHNLKGNWSNAGTYNHNNGKWILNGTSAQSVNSTNFYDLTLNNAAGVTFTGNLTIDGDFSNASGSILNSGVYTHSLKGAWSNLGTFNTSTGKWIFNGSSAQTLGATTFYALEANNAAGVTFTGIMLINGNFTNASGSVLNAGAFTHNLKGNWLNQGTFNNNGGKWILNGTSAQTMSGSVFYDLEINNAAGVTMLTNETVTNNLTLTLGNFNVGANTLAISNPILGTPNNLQTTSSSGLTIEGGGSGISIPSSVTDLGTLTINNLNGLFTNGLVKIHSSLALTLGVIATDATNTLRLMSGSSITGASNASHVSPIMQWEYASSSLIENPFPVGINGVLRPFHLGISHNNSVSNTYSIQVFGAPGYTTLKPGSLLQAVSGDYHHESSRVVDGGNAINQRFGKVYFFSGDGITDPSSLRVGAGNGTQWQTTISPLVSVGATIYGEMGSVLGYENDQAIYDWVLGSEDAVANPLPVNLISFNGAYANENVNLTWVTASEQNNRGFHIERSVNGADFETVGFVSGNGTTNKRIEYTFTDAKPLAVAYYRLRQEDFNGKTETHKVILVKSDAKNTFVSNVWNSNDKVYASVNGVNSDKYVADIFDLNGKLMFTQSGVIQKGINNIEFNIGNLNKGLYLLRFTSGDNQSFTKWVK